MASVEKLLVFVASPSDVPTERRYVQEVVEELNRTVADEKGFVLQAIRWEDDAFPGYGQDAQELINRQIAEMSRYSLFIGIVWNRLGTPTPRAESGTVEEFERAIQAREQNGQPEIWFYFRQAAAELDTAEQLDQRKRVLVLKERVQANGLPWIYRQPSEFRDKLRSQLVLWLNARAFRKLKSDVDDVKEKEAVLRSEVDALRFLVTGFVTDWEMVHLQKLAKPEPFFYQRSAGKDDRFISEIIRLRDFGLVSKRIDYSLWDIPLMGDLKMYVELTERGRTYLTLREQMTPNN